MKRREGKVVHFPGTALQTLKGSLARKPKAVVILEIDQDGEGIVSWSRQSSLDLMLAERRLRLTVDQLIADGDVSG